VEYREQFASLIWGHGRTRPDDLTRTSRNYGCFRSSKQEKIKDHWETLLPVDQICIAFCVFLLKDLLYAGWMRSKAHLQLIIIKRLVEDVVFQIQNLCKACF
jgi:hypothetical protein